MANKIDISKMEDDLFFEMLEVYINAILYLREVYPSAIFRKRRVYSTTTYVSIYPTLNDYLINVLKTAQQLKLAKKLFAVEVIIFQRGFELFGTPEDEEILERYVFRVQRDENDSANKKDLPLYILRFEEGLRRGLMELNQKAKNLNRLNPEFCGFRIHLETTEKAYVNLVNEDNSSCKPFPWKITSEKESGEGDSKPHWHMLPIVQVDSFSLLALTTKAL